MAGIDRDANRPRLIVRDSDGERIYTIDEGAVTLGRGEENDIEVNDLSCSRRHCRILRRNGRWEIVDLESRNGTLVNGILVMQKDLCEGDAIEIGRTRIFFQNESVATGVPTLRLDTAYFLDPLVQLPVEEQIEALRSERAVFLRILEVVKVLNTTRVLKDVLRTILEIMLDVTACEHGLVLLGDEKSGTFTLRAFRKIDAENAAREAQAVAHALGGMLLEAGGAVLCSDFGRDTRFHAFGDLAALAPRAFLCLPFRAEGETIGMIYVDTHREAGLLGEHQVRLAEILAAQAAIAIRNARLFGVNRRRQRELEQAKARLEELTASLREQVTRQAGSLQEAVDQAESSGRPALRYDYSEIVTASARMHRVFAIVDKVAESGIPVLVEGESGTGKELIARAIHFNGQRAAARFVSENCAAIPASLLESEFFGYEQGAFTGAARSKPGLFELAHQGTLFLDEIGDMPLGLQGKFLRVLENGQLRRVGGSKVITVDVRILSATNQNLRALVAQGRFREDLYYRLNVVTISLPPLRERKEDLPLLIAHFLGAIAARTGQPLKAISPDALRLLESYAWPGNIRELANELERLAALSPGEIDANLVAEHIAQSAGGGPRRGARSLRAIVKDAIEEIEQDVITAALQEHGWKKTCTASVLGISRPTLDSKIEKYRIRRGR